jgi:hypothetical protein
MAGEWINIGISILVPNEKLEGVNTLLQPYATELGWELSSTSPEKEDKSQILIAPSSGRISPEELNERINKIAGVSFSLLKDLAYLGDREKALQKYMQGFVLTVARNPKTKKQILFLGHTMGFLWFNYPLGARMELEKENRELALSLFFNQTAEEQLRDYFQKKKPEEHDAKLKAAIEKAHGFKL